MKTIKKIVACILIVLVLYSTITIAGIYKYLKEYGYSAYALPQTLAVYFGLSNGFTVYEIPDSETSVFIGRHDDYIYKEIFEEHGYYEADRMGLLGLYNKTNVMTDEKDFSVMSRNEWCHWFRIYSISDGYKIEDFK
ncbi:MAG: hypothetical protein UH854_00050 [Clostridia bacterium]|nr:hypothetical protein [Clostridia bacterium]